MFYVLVLAIYNCEWYNSDFYLSNRVEVSKQTRYKCFFTTGTLENPQCKKYMKNVKIIGTKKDWWRHIIEGVSGREIR